jgi:hypothetical protein
MEAHHSDGVAMEPDIPGILRVIMLGWLSFFLTQEHDLARISPMRRMSCWM